MKVKQSEPRIDGLYNQFNRWPHRHEERLLAGREHLTFYNEGRIVRQLLQCKATGIAQRQKIDSCLKSYKNELSNLSRIFAMPVGDIHTAEPAQTHTPAELAEKIRQYTDYMDIAGRELLIEYADRALDALEAAEDRQPVADLAAALAEAGRKEALRIPQWVNTFLSEAVKDWQKHPRVPDTDMVMPMLTLALLNHDPALERKAARIIRRCYKACRTNPTPAGLRIAISCREYTPAMQ